MSVLACHVFFFCFGSFCVQRYRFVKKLKKKRKSAFFCPVLEMSVRKLWFNCERKAMCVFFFL